MKFYPHAVALYRKANKRVRPFLGGRDLDAYDLMGAWLARTLLEDPNTQRILFDTRQAEAFAALEQLPPSHALAKIHTPFPVFYLEFTRPLKLGSRFRDTEASIFERAVLPEGIEEEEVRKRASGQDARAVVVRSDSVRIRTRAHPEGILVSTVLFIHANGGGDIADTGFLMDLRRGHVYVNERLLGMGDDPSELPETYQVSHRAEVVGKLEGENLIRIGATSVENIGRHIGRFERSILPYAVLLSWINIYMMAKGISVVKTPVSKKERKQLEANQIQVKPWHVIVVDPKFGREDGTGSQIGHKHSYRYDVMGHLRFGNHRARDAEGNWTRRRTVEWVSPHQRGIHNVRYVPAVRHYKSGKETHPAFQDYMDGRGEA